MLHDCRYQATLLINWLPQYNPEVLRQKLLLVKSESPKKAIAVHRALTFPTASGNI
jgi:hypothetical protein